VSIKLAVIAAVAALFLVTPTALLAEQPPALSSALGEAEYAGDRAAETTISTGRAETPVAGASLRTNEDEASADEAAKSPARAAATTSAATTVVMGDFFYRPRDVTVSAGDTVTWINEGTVPEGHTATGEGFDSGVREEGETYSHKFESAGTFDYVCTLHPNMRGTVTVTASASGADEGGSGAADDDAGGSGTGGVPSTTPTTTDTGDSSGTLASTGLNLVLLAEIGVCLLAAGLLVRRLRYGWPF
jgi:plastocyanin